MSRLDEVLQAGLFALEHCGGGCFLPISPVPDWLSHVVPDQSSPTPLNSAFLENFLVDAESFWHLGQPGRLRSGPWIEVDPVGEERALEASAISSDGKQYLVLEALGAAYDEKRRILQQAREHNLEFHSLTKAFKEHAQAAREHAREAAKLQSLISDAPVNLVVTDAEGIITLAQGKDLYDFGLNQQPLVGSSIRVVFASRPDMIERFEWAMAGEYVKGIEGHQDQVFEVTYSILRSVNNQAIGVVRHAHDITDRTRAAELVAEAINDVHSHYQQGFDFLEVVSQELRGPLVAMVGFMEVIRNGMAGPVSEAQREYLGDINRSGEHLLSLLGDLSSYAQIESGRLQLKLELLDLRSTVESACSVLQNRLQRAGVGIELRIASGLKLMADASRLREIINNLLELAIGHAQGSLLIDAFRQGEELIMSFNPALSLELNAQEVEHNLPEAVQSEGMRLALTRRLVQMHHGLLFVIPQGDSLEVQMRLPAGKH